MSDATAFARHVETIRRKLSTVTPVPRAALANKSNAAAVLMPLFERAGGLHVIYIRRSDHVASHRGQVAFPGGRVDPVDATLLDAALREAHEEVGIHPSTVEVVGAFPTMQTTTSGIVVAPFVGVIPSDAPLRPQISEVAEIFDVPLTALRDPKFRGEYEWKSDGPAGRSSKFPAILYRGQVIWGLTLRITLNLLELLETAPFSAHC
ncbi:CoA pyrophosphatase [Candidatus Binatus sp.]|uniref:NUDIX hydrolase n=1 Tax=Candidatus Binatus sp. TaxID=2811406 RepID=UPI002F95A5EB